MQLTQYTDYSLRVLIYLDLYNKELATISEIAKSYNISRNHLGKVVHNLANLGYIDTTRGKGGGMRLSQAPENINIGQVVRQTEGRFDLAECFNAAHNTCSISSCCELKNVFWEARCAFIAVLDRYTLADIVKNKSQLRSSLQIEWFPPKAASH
ncbi:transcriptional regulator, BadM/Rrf2 family [Nitrosococcus oceani ATCC 19707]|uniref:Transcriptional regulator, BadM/Rrf2 family n=2 Tax=Nitrosococcus oceani TaxID=1229 RepID=Q3J6Y7_NITOC|nr:Rrf2 family transcriptional regulator [Nitrosococcus oceani]ABA59409.1 transcriptional regulator, BadM/Rrf2 family [Nitrosococcus oceani ATCC 19707]EDZ65750.1 Transcriptional regulator superfamily [Nitrosococcus oceani AFC27]KFI18151.1 BadM/Rrf2 family transcriptional regulator [Nitrosococcus oceani C-27]GEM20020.1 Rrf2 family transcriptional regulator [Nitrosococcus oceani]